ncbi:hypothetical protein LTR35_017519 [Friedmanniomyces endolithicus]|uniref:Uncharacterized protein n=1 Tax=Friedmanniomyces endolithicus TaxID=329885 RepID=A0AAN6IZA9_9PEZI|nr:hypothetical protein LTR35_017519 [Friedmanniomyces endolithicus]KAK0268705.1 hypothetical protein LTS00_017483 [Friedmanniomyces endolithicus]KAK0303244.1 hypothetical protein LTR82_017624 [Friedmanniomyces endolithicus]KAK0971926.1 hypothetical protein LTR54_017690 [Friedmanniomyces endolithicus]
MTLLDVHSTLDALALKYRMCRRFACNKAWNIRTIVGFRYLDGEAQYKLSWENSVLPDWDLVCVLVDRYPLGNDVKELYRPIEDDEEVVVVWQETWVSANLLVHGKGLLLHEFWVRINVVGGLEQD